MRAKSKSRDQYRTVTDEVLIEEIVLLAGRGFRSTVVQIAASLRVGEDRIRAVVNASDRFEKVRDGRLFYVEISNQ